MWNDTNTRLLQYGGSPIKVGEDEYSLFRDHEYVGIISPQIVPTTDRVRSILAKINE